MDYIAQRFYEKHFYHLNRFAENIVLRLDHLGVGYHRHTVLSGIDSGIRHGDFVCLMGPNGIGKSTLIRTIAGLQKPLSGKVVINGQALTAMSQTELAKAISLVLTDKINAGNLSGYELIAMGRYPYTSWRSALSENDHGRIENAIAQTHIEGFVHKKIYELSDGQLQKIIIAKAIAQDTPVLLLDEPTAHLDLNNRVEVVNMLKTLTQTQQKTVLMSTHELDLALQTADRLWLIGSDGKVVQGIPEDLVLSGVIDEVFQLKGFDLKTGILKKKSLGKKVALKGESYSFRWTKNALERNGYELDDRSGIKISIIEGQGLCWSIEKDGVVTTNSVESLIDTLNKDYF